MSVTINEKRPLHLFDGFGVEMEYMIVDRSSLNIQPASDRILVKPDGTVVNELSHNGMAWSNELALHVIEVKTNGAAASLNGLSAEFQSQIRDINHRLSEMNLALMPGAIHPWMDPYREVKLWPHEYNPIYEAYNRIFDCRGHGWANLQSTHLNLPFDGDEEFGKLHAALRLVLPVIPALAASSPVADGEIKPWLDYRMEMYRTNSLKIPSITGLVIPEQVFTQKEYSEQIFKRMYKDISPHDPEGILQDEWLNSRGAMSRWDRGAIEIRVIDIQEFPGADIAILEWVVNLTRHLVSEGFAPYEEQISWHENQLYSLLLETIKHGDKAVVSNSDYLRLFGLSGVQGSITAGELCRQIYLVLEQEYEFTSESKEILGVIFDEGPLGRRILHALNGSITQEKLYKVYNKLCYCLQDGTPFIP